MKRFIEKTLNALTIILILWICLSFAEINAKNLTENPTYSDYNALCLLLEVVQADTPDTAPEFTPEVTVDRIEDGGIAVVEIVYEDCIEFVDIPVDQLGVGVTEGDKLPYDVIADIIDNAE